MLPSWKSSFCVCTWKHVTASQRRTRRVGKGLHIKSMPAIRKKQTTLPCYNYFLCNQYCSELKSCVTTPKYLPLTLSSHFIPITKSYHFEVNMHIRSFLLYGHAHSRRIARICMAPTSKDPISTLKKPAPTTHPSSTPQTPLPHPPTSTAPPASPPSNSQPSPPNSPPAPPSSPP